ncbi:MAG TPA: hypothetical protein VM307_16130 [Egibacteraceae bacterium]|nr:hypothetical protein [Egibacteraceae bacterium]
MRIRKLLVAVFVLALAVPAFASAQGQQYWTTGGGQVIASSEAQGPGDTIAFVARLAGEVIGQTEGEEDIYAARGQLQVVNRSEGRGRDQDLFHGNVTCIVPRDDSTTRFGGTGRDPRTGAAMDFVVDLEDHQDQGQDTIAFRRYEPSEDPADPCERDDDVTELRDLRLARGNAKIHDRR